MNTKLSFVTIFLLLSGIVSSQPTYVNMQKNLLKILPDGRNPEMQLMANSQPLNRKSRLSAKIARLDATIDEVYDTIARQYIPEYKTSFHYNVSGTPDSLGYYNWDTVKSDWSLSSKNILSYNAAGSLVRRVSSNYIPETDGWVYSLKLNYGMDTLLKTGMSNQYRFRNNVWDHVSSRIFNYGNEINPGKTISYMENSLTKTWETAVKESMGYDDAGRLTWDETMFWNSTSGKWVPFWVLGFEYDANGNLIAETINTWDYSALKYQPSVKYEFVYDNEKLFADIMSPQSSWLVYSFVGNFVNKPLYATGSRLVNGQWIPDSRTTYIYSDLATAIPVGELPSVIKVYPNPTSGTVRIELADKSAQGNIQLYDLTGRQLIVKEFTGFTDLSLLNLQTKTLIYNVRTQKEVLSGKILLSE